MFVIPDQPFFFFSFAHRVYQSSRGLACSDSRPRLHGTFTSGPVRQSSMSRTTCDVSSGWSHLKSDMLSILLRRNVPSSGDICLAWRKVKKVPGNEIRRPSCSGFGSGRGRVPSLLNLFWKTLQRLFHSFKRTFFRCEEWYSSPANFRV